MSNQPTPPPPLTVDDLISKLRQANGLVIRTQGDKNTRHTAFLPGQHPISAMMFNELIARHVLKLSLSMEKDGVTTQTYWIV